MDRKLTELDIHQIQRRTYEEGSEAIRVTFVGQAPDITLNQQVVGYGTPLKEIQVIEVPKIIVETKIQEVKEAFFIPQYEKIEIPTIVREVDVKTIEVPVIIKEQEIKTIDIPTIVREVQIVEVPVIIKEVELRTIEIPVITEKIVYVDKPIIVKETEIKIIEVPKIIKEIEFKEVEKIINQPSEKVYEIINKPSNLLISIASLEAVVIIGLLTKLLF